MAMTIVGKTRPVTGGVDTHLDVHVAAALDANGGLLGVESFPAERSGYAALHTWLTSFGELTRVGVEGTGAYGVGLGSTPVGGGGRGDRGRSAQPPGATTGRQVRHPRRGRGGSGGVVGSGWRPSQDQGGRRGSD